MPLDRRRRAAAQVVCSCSIFMVIMDSTVVNVSLPDMMRSFDTSVGALQWVIDAYLGTLAALLIFSGALADRFGRRRIFRLGLIVFGSGSLLCGLAPSIDTLIAARVLQAVGGSMLNPVAVAIIASMFPAGQERAKAMGVWSAVSGVALAIGPVTGGLMVDSLGWRYVFFLNIPIVLGVFYAAGRVLPKMPANPEVRLDIAGQLLLILVVAGSISALIEGPRRGIDDPLVVVCWATALLASLAFVLAESRSSSPIVDLRLFGRYEFCTAMVLALVAFGSYNGVLLLVTLYLQSFRGIGATATGLFLLPTAAMMIVWPPVSSRLLNRYGVHMPVILAGLGLTSGPILLLMVRVTDSIVVLLGGLILVGVGLGSVNAPILVSAISGLPEDRTGVAAAMASTARQVGGAFGVAVVGTLLASGLHGGDFSRFPTASTAAWSAVAVGGAICLGIGLFGWRLALFRSGAADLDERVVATRLD